jgi:hypothetical protein
VGAATGHGRTAQATRPARAGRRPGGCGRGAHRWPDEIRVLAAVDQIQPGNNYLAALGRHCAAEPLPHVTLDLGAGR